MVSHSDHGVSFAALSSLLFSVCTLIAKFLSPLHPVQLSSFSFLGILLVSGLPALLRKECLFPKGYRKLLALRSFAGTLFLVSSFFAVQLIPLGDASVLFYTAPSFTAILAKLFLKEPLTWYSCTMNLLVVVCVIMVIKPPFLFTRTEMTSNYALGVGMAILASMSEAIGNVVLRDLKSVHFSIVAFNYGLMSFIQSLILSWFFAKWVFLDSSQLALVIVLVLFASCEQLLMTIALSIEEAGPVALIQASDIIYGYIFQVMFFGELLDGFSVIGAILVGCVVFYTARMKRQYYCEA